MGKVGTPNDHKIDQNAVTYYPTWSQLLGSESSKHFAGDRGAAGHRLQGLQHGDGGRQLRFVGDPAVDRGAGADLG
jgi:hypothetical protein